MKRYKPTTFLLLAAISLCALTSCDNNDNNLMTPVDKPDIEFYGLSSDNRLMRYNANAAEMAISSVTISGISGGEQVIAIDFRPATGQLYGITSLSRIYFINPSTGIATPVGVGPFTPAISGTIVGFDFNPTVDRIRLVTSGGQNLRLNPETGTVAATDGVINPGTPAIAGAAYNNSVAGSSMTTLFDIDLANKILYKQDPPNDGKLVEVGSLDIDGTPTDAGFDISYDNAVALAAMTDGSTSKLYQIDLTTGQAVTLGDFSTSIIGLAIPTAPVAYAVDANNNLQIFNFTSAGTPVTKPITGLAMGESILGIDMRPATGQLFAIGSTSRLYAINMSSGAAVAIGDAPFATLLDGTSFGFDFNPTVDRVRLVSNTGQNLRLNPITGAIAAVDMKLNPGTPAVSAAAYANNFAGATTTTLFDIDCTTDKLLMQVPPNDGTLVEIGSLGTDIDSSNGFDIGGTSNMAYGVFTSGGSTRIYSINTTTGAATVLSDYPNPINGFAVGLGF